MPLGLAQLASGMLQAVEPNIYEDELNGIGIEGLDPPESDREIN